MTDSISYRVVGEETPVAVRLNYTQTNRSSGDKKDIDYGIHLITTTLPWGGERYWFVCPLIINNLPCHRRVGCLYLPPNGQYFGCRHCYNLTYRSSQESGQFKSVFESLAGSMQDEYPGITGRDVRYLLQDKHTRHMEEIVLNNISGGWKPPPDRYLDYLTAEELCQQSGLSVDDLYRLEEIRLLVPDTSDGRFRPKLVGWARKLNYLLKAGWEPEEIKRWAKGRFQMGNPKEWPPESIMWKKTL